MAFHLPRLVVRFIGMFIYPAHAFQTEIILLHRDVEEARGSPLVQQPLCLVGALRAKDVPDHGFLLGSDVGACYAHSGHFLPEILDLEIIQVDEVMGIPDIP